MTCFKRFALVLSCACVSLCFAGCSAGGFPSRASASSSEISVSPPSAIVAAGSVTTFAAVFMPVPTAEGSFTWSVAPAIGGTITNAGVYTATATPGDYSVVATWTAANPASGGIFSASAEVQVLPVPQQGAAYNSDVVQASGGLQTIGTTQNGVIDGQSVPSAIATDSNGDIQNRSGFTPPVVCPDSSTTC
jgi:hypothetical protein